MKYRGQYPKDWNVSLLDDVTSRASGHTPNKNHPEYWNGGIKWVSLADSPKLDTGLIAQTDKEISRDGLKHSSAVLLPKGTVIISRDAGVGKSAVLAEEMAVSQHFIAWKCDGPNQLHNWLQLNKPEFERQAIGSTIKTIGLPFFKRIKIAHPTYEEQRRIAEILSTWDQAIETTEKLIANAEAQKKALMQQLLTGKKRLPGFRGKWATYALKSLSSQSNKNSFIDGDWIESPHIKDKGIRLIQTGNIGVGHFKNETKKYISQESFEELKCKEVFPGDILICRLADPAGRSSIVPQLPEKLITSVDVTIFRTDTKIVDPAFLLHQLNQQSFLNNVSSRCGGSTRSRIARSELGKIKIELPEKAEQSAIAKVLDNVQKQILAAQQELLNLRKEKAALMQQLLTGKRRVKIEEPSP